MKLSKKKIEAQVSAIYYKNCSGIQIDIMDIGKIFAVGEASIIAGDNEEVTTRKIVEFVRSISQ